MKGKWIVVSTIAAAIALTATVKAATFGAAPFWPNDGIWIYYDGEGYAWEVGIWVYCGYACTEWSALYEIPPSPSSQWVQDPISHGQWWEYPALYSQFEQGEGAGYSETYFTGNAIAGWNCDWGNRAMLNQEYINFPNPGASIYWGISGYPGYIPGCDSWGGGLQYGSPSWNTGEWDWYVNRNNWNQYFFDAIQSNYGASIHVESVYRNPHKNATIVPPGAPDSRHQWGDAMDTKPDGYGSGCTLGGGVGSGSAWETLYNATWAAGGCPIGC